jgi:hypothetical protein
MSKESIIVPSISDYSFLFYTDKLPKRKNTPYVPHLLSTHLHSPTCIMAWSVIIQKTCGSIDQLHQKGGKLH